MVGDGPLVDGIETQHVDAVPVECDVVLVFVKVETSDTRLPELEALVPEDGALILVRGDIDYLDVVSVDEDSLETDHEFLEAVGLVSDDVD